MSVHVEKGLFVKNMIIYQDFVSMMFIYVVKNVVKNID